MSKQGDSPLTIFENLLKTKIPILSGKGSVNNRLILESIAIKGPMLKYGIHQVTGLIYSTANRRVTNLEKRGYIEEANRRATHRGKQLVEPMYGLNWKGLIACLSTRAIRENLLQVLKNNPLLDFPAKDFVLAVVEELFSTEEIGTTSLAFFIGFLKSNAPSIEEIQNEELGMWIYSSIREMPPIPEQTKKAKDLSKLLDNPTVLKYVKETIVPWIAENEKNLYQTYQLFRELNKIGQFISALQIEDKPSESLKRYLETEKLEIFAIKEEKPI